MRIEVFVPRGWWALWSLSFGLVGLGLLVYGLLIFAGGLVALDWFTVVGGAVASLGGAFGTTVMVVAARLATSRPFVEVTPGWLEVSHCGYFRQPIRLDRTQVHSVYVQRFSETSPVPVFAGSRWNRFRQWMRWIDSGEQFAGPVPMSGWYAPDLSAEPLGRKHPDVLIILNVPLPIGSDVRRGLGVLSASLAFLRIAPLHAPTRASRIRGFFAVAVNPDTACAALSGWPSREAPPHDAWQWLFGN